jgi:hypothetical protein
MNQSGAKHYACEEHRDTFSRVAYGLGMVLLMFGIFVTGAHNLMGVGLALLAIAWVVEW